MKTSTKLRCVGGAIIVFDLWLIGQYNITGMPVLLLTVGVAAVFEAFVALPATSSIQAQSGHAQKPSAVLVYGGGILFVMLSAGAIWGFLGAKSPTAEPAATLGAFNPNDLLVTAPKELGFIDRWRFDSCMTDAAKNPTAHGVNTAARVCRRRFEQ